MHVAAIQMVSSRSVQENLSRAEILLCQAKEQGADIALFPETFLTYGIKAKPDLNLQQKFLDDMSSLAARMGIWVVAGTFPLSDSLLRHSESSPKPYAASVVFNNRGEIAGQYLKIHLFDADVGDSTKTYRESDEYSHGGSALVFQTPWCGFGIAVCYDLRFPELFSQLVTKGAKVILIPSAFTSTTGKAHWEVLVRARAIESQCYVIAANQGGKHESGRETWGETMIVNPWGEVMSKLGKGEGVVSEYIDLALVEEIRRDMPVQQHRRLI